MDARRLLDWWGRGLAAPWPEWLRRWCRPHRRSHWIQTTGDGFQIQCRRGSKYDALAEIGGASELPEKLRRRLKSSTLIYRLPREDALVRSFSVPEGTRAQDPAYIRSLLNQISPLPVDQLYTGSSTANGGRTLTLAITPRSGVDAKLDTLRSLDIEVDAVSVDGDADDSLNLLPDRGGRPRALDVTGVALVVAGLLLCTAGIFLSFQDQRQAAASLELRRQALEQELAAGQAVRERMDALETRARAISKRRGETGFALALLAAVTRAVPQHSWLRSWVLRGEELILLGESGDTGDLIARLEASPLLKNVRYDAAITRDPVSNRDRFRLAAAAEKQ